MANSTSRWVRVKPLTAAEKAEIGARCNAFIADTLVPSFLPEMRPTEWNYPVGLHGKWRGSKYSFIIRYRSGWEHNKGEEFDSPWLRLDHDEEHFDEPRFHIYWMRHTGKWWPLHYSVPLDEALRMIETDGILQPHS